MRTNGRYTGPQATPCRRLVLLGVRYCVVPTGTPGGGMVPLLMLMLTLTLIPILIPILILILMFIRILARVLRPYRVVPLVREVSR